MFNKILQVFVLFGLLGFYSTTWAQTYQEMIQKGTYTVFEIQEKAEKHFEEVGTGRGTGYKQFKRWEYNALREMDEDGYLPDQYTQYQEHQRFQRAYKRKNRTARVSSESNWSELGPTYWNQTSGWNPGVGRITSIAVDENNYNHIIVGAHTGGVWRTTDKGQNWAPLSDNFSTMSVNSLAIDPQNSNTYYWGAGSGTIFKSTDAGQTWTTVGNAGFGGVIRILVHPTNSDVLFAAGSGFYKSTNGGASWTKVGSASSGYDLQFKPNDPNTVYASGNGFYRSTDGGNTFTQVTTGGGVQMIGVSDDDPNRVYVVEADGGKFGSFYRSNNSGASFTKENHTGKNYFGYSTSADDNSGQAPRDMAITVNPNDADEVHIAGINTWRSLNGGTSFTATSDWVPSRTVNKNIGYCHADVDIMVFYGNTLYVGTDGGFFIAENTKNLNKDYYTDLTVGMGIRQFYKIGVSQSENVVVSGGSQDNGTSVMKGTDQTWYDWLGADGMESFVDWNNVNNLYGTSQNGSLYRSTNGGQSYNGLSKPESSGAWVTPFEQDPQVSTTIYSGYKKVYKSTNSGSSWTAISQDFGQVLSQMKIARSDNKVIYASRGNALYKTTTGGASGNWESLTGYAGFINYISIHPNDPNKVAVATTGGQKVYVSNDGGQTWNGFLKNLPNLTAYCVVWDDNATNGLYVGMSYGIYYIDDVLSEWEPFMTGIPNAKVNELEINFVNDKIYAGTYGRGLWVSDVYQIDVASNDAAISAIIEPSFGEVCGFTEKAAVPVVEIKNLGNDRLTSAEIKIAIDGQVVTTYNYSGNLAFGQTEQVTLPEITIPSGIVTLKAYTTNPNGQEDESPDNDSQETVLKVIDGEEYQVRLKNDANPEQTTWQITNDEGVIVGALENNIGVNAYEESFKNVCLSNDCYTFTIFDSGGNGMRIWILSEYEVTKVDGGESVVYGKGNEFTDEKSHDFCISNVVVNDDAAITGINNLPNGQCGNEVDATITLRNLGVQRLTSVELQVEVNGSLVKTINHTTSLSKGESEEVDLALNLSQSGTNNIKVTAVNPNGNTDENPSNDSKTEQAVIFIGTPHEFFISERSMNDGMTWLLTNEQGEEVESGNANDLTSSGDLAIAELCLANGCYNFKVTDAFAAGGCDAEPWSATKAYSGGDVVSYNGKKYVASYYSLGSNPEDNNGQFGKPWLLPTECSITYDEDFYGFREVGSTENLAYTTVANYTSPTTDNICVGSNDISVDFSANKTVATQCDEITFTANVTGDANNYEWKFGDGQTANGVGPHTVSYQTSGTKTITLTVNGTEVETKTAYININDNASILPTINISLSNGSNPSCSSDELTFETIGTNIENGATYQWFLNGNEIEEGAIFTHSQFQDQDEVSVEVTTNASCLTNVKGSSDVYIVERTAEVTPTIAIQTEDFPSCEGNFVKFTAEVENEGNNPSYKWFVGDVEMAQSTSFETSDLLNGEEVICELVSDATCATITEVASNVIVAQIEVCTGVLPSAFEAVNVYPNPATSKLNIDLGSLAGKQAKWTLYNTYGQTIHAGTKAVSEGFIHTVDMSSLPSATYFLKIETEGNSTVIKVEKK
ncbi:MAG: T9SS type A sorting domain-containing protein [Cytophagales bacterium]|nr:T9SS type A sorting domain-containing protein [Cytophagales bacterium]